jgi:hypothetical protein
VSVLANTGEAGAVRSRLPNSASGSHTVMLGVCLQTNAPFYASRWTRAGPRYTKLPSGVESKELMDTLRCQEKSQHRIECGVYFVANDKVVDYLCILPEILHAVQPDFAYA